MISNEVLRVTFTRVVRYDRMRTKMKPNALLYEEVDPKLPIGKEMNDWYSENKHLY